MSIHCEVGLFRKCNREVVGKCTKCNSYFCSHHMDSQLKICHKCLERHERGVQQKAQKDALIIKYRKDHPFFQVAEHAPMKNQKGLCGYKDCSSLPAELGCGLCGSKYCSAHISNSKICWKDYDDGKMVYKKSLVCDYCNHLTHTHDLRDFMAIKEEYNDIERYVRCFGSKSNWQKLY
jgi:hypothetical protein